MNVLNKKLDTIPRDAVYIGRPSIWGNPFVIGKHGDRDQVCDQYDILLKLRINSGQITTKDVLALEGKDLVCWCAPLRCHGHSIQKLVEQAIKERDSL